jgi:hypothetical protein
LIEIGCVDVAAIHARHLRNAGSCRRGRLSANGFAGMTRTQSSILNGRLRFSTAQHQAGWMVRPIKVIAA